MESSGSFQGGTRTSTSRRSENAHVDTRDRRVLQPITARTCDVGATLPSNGIVYCGYKRNCIISWKFRGKKGAEKSGAEAAGSGGDVYVSFGSSRRKQGESLFFGQGKDLFDEEMRML